MSGILCVFFEFACRVYFFACHFIPSFGKTLPPERELVGFDLLLLDLRLEMNISSSIEWKFRSNRNYFPFSCPRECRRTTLLIHLAPPSSFLQPRAELPPSLLLSPPSAETLFPVLDYSSVNSSTSTGGGNISSSSSSSSSGSGGAGLVAADNEAMIIPRSDLSFRAVSVLLLERSTRLAKATSGSQAGTCEICLAFPVN